MTKRKNRSARAVVVGAISLVILGAFIAACGLDDSVVDQTGGPNSGSDATIGGDGANSDGAISTDDASDAVPDVPHIFLDGADPDDADLSDATVADGGCASGEYSCAFGGNTYCLGDCSACVGLNYACAGTSTCVDSCVDCSSTKVECFRAGLLGNENYCVDEGSSCSGISGSPVFCGSLGFYVVECPGVDQVCVGNKCLTCGETTTLGQACSPSKSGTCNSTDLKCE